MIPQSLIQEWKSKAPWQDNAQVEQDLILSRALVDIFKPACNFCYEGDNHTLLQRWKSDALM